LPPETVQVVCPQCDAANRVPRARLHERSRCGRCKSDLFTGYPLALNERNFEAHLTRGTAPLVVDFWATWCAPCRVMAPVFENAARVLEPGLRLAKVNTEEAPALAARYAIRSIPTLILFHEGREIARQSGALSGAALMAWVRAHAPA
jgi:thioredoxin 2